MAASRTALGTLQYVMTLAGPNPDGKMCHPPVVGAGSRYYFVGSAGGYKGGGSNGNTGLDPEAPLATVAYALDNLVTAGDCIVVMRRHAESIAAAAGWDIDTAGVQVWGVPAPAQSEMPAISFTTATTADIDFDAAGTGVHNLRFICAIDDLAAALDVNSASVSVTGCCFDAPTTAVIPLNWIDGATAADALRLLDCWTSGIANGEDTASKNTWAVLNGSDDYLIRGNRIFGSYRLACIEAVTTAALRGFGYDNLLVNLDAGTAGRSAIALVASSTGHWANNSGFIGGASAITLANAFSVASCSQAENYVQNDASESGGLSATAST